MALYFLYSSGSNSCIVTELNSTFSLTVLFIKDIGICKGVLMHYTDKVINIVFYSIPLQVLGN